MVNRYVILAVSIISLVSVIMVFTDDGEDSFDHTGIVHDIRASTSGFTFEIDVSTGTLRCFSYESPVEMGHYGIRGSASDTMFFVSSMECLDEQG